MREVGDRGCSTKGAWRVDYPATRDGSTIFLASRYFATEAGALAYARQIVAVAPTVARGWTPLTSAVR